jgi:hypothetical protein
MLDEAPHILQKCIKGAPVLDRAGRQVSEASEAWEDVAECFCHDNSQMKQVAVNGEMWTYSFHVVYEGSKLPLDTKVRCIDKQTQATVGEGFVKKHAECYSREFQGRCDVWL